MNIKERVRHYWHELYYKMASPAGVEFALRCKDVVEQIDLSDPPITWRKWFRIRLHLSFCQACNNYLRASQTLGRAVCETLKNSEAGFDVEKVNQELLKKYAQSYDRGRKK
jgi:hypothetical protein